MTVFADFRRLARRRKIEEDMPLVKQLRLGRVEVFRLLIRQKSAASKRDDAPFCIHDREDQPPTKTIIGDRNVVAVDQKTGVLHLGKRKALAAKMLLQGRLVVRRIAEPEKLDFRELNAALFEISSRSAPLATGER